MTKTLGQVAYEAFGLGPPRDPPWPKLWKQEQKWWQAAAEAVAAKIGNRELQAKSLAELDAECAVIEAAKALHEAWMEEWDPSDPRLHPVHVRFKLAVDEMLTVEVEGE